MNASPDSESLITPATWRAMPKSTLALLVLGAALWASWLACPYLLYGERSFLRIHDCGDSNVPMAVAAHLKPEGALVGQRNASLVCGFNHTATWGHILQDQLLAGLPVWLGYGLNMWLQRFAAGLGMALLCLTVMRFRWLPSIVAATGYALFSQWSINDSWGGFTYYDAMVLPGVPWILLGIQFSLNLWPKYGYLSTMAAAVTLGTAYAWTGSYILALFPMALFAVWTFWVVRPKSMTFLAVMNWLAVFGLSWAAWCSPYILAALSSGEDSQRSGLLQSQSISEGFVSGWNYTIGSLKDNWAFVFVIAVALPFRLNPLFRKLLLLLIGLILIVFLSKPLTIILGPLLGFLQGFNWQRFYLLLPFLIMLTAAAALDAMTTSPNSAKPPSQGTKTYRIVGVVACLSLLTWIAKISAEVHEFAIKLTVGGWTSAVFSHPAIEELADLRKSQPPFRVVTLSVPGSNQWHPDMMAAYGLESADGYVPLYSRSYNEFWQAVIAPRLAEDPHLKAKVANWGNRAYLFSPSVLDKNLPLPIKSIANLQLLAQANVRFILSEIPLIDDDLTLWHHTPEQAPPKHKRNTLGRMHLLSNGFTPWKSLYIYELSLFRSRFSLTSKVVWTDSTQDSIELMSSAQFDKAQNPIVIPRHEVSDGLRYSVSNNNITGSQVNLVKLSADHIILNVESVGDAFLLIRNSYDPKWRASINGIPQTIFKANHAFQAVLVLSGNHQLELSYGR
jgi:hypothetical protein